MITPRTIVAFCLGVLFTCLLLITVIPAKAEVFDLCPSGHVGIIDGTPTTCMFAEEVRVAWFSQPRNPVVAYSPVTGRLYAMNCISSTETVSGVSLNGWTCIGGSDAAVVIWR